MSGPFLCKTVWEITLISVVFPVQTLAYPGDENEASGATAHVWEPQPNRCNYVPPPYDDTPCYLNQRTCNSRYTSSRLGR